MVNIVIYLAIMHCWIDICMCASVRASMRFSNRIIRNKHIQGGYKKGNQSSIQILNSQQRYEIIRYIDQGRYSMVFEGIHTTSNQSVIIKVLKSGKCRSEKEQKEIQILTCLLGCPGIVQLHAISDSDGADFNYLIFENSGSGTYQPFSHRYGSSFTEEEVKKYFYSLLKALKSCRDARVMHRDVKPRNIIIDRQEESLRLIDFGLRYLFEVKY